MTHRRTAALAPRARRAPAPARCCGPGCGGRPTPRRTPGSRWSRRPAPRRAGPRRGDVRAADVTVGLPRRAHQAPAPTGRSRCAACRRSPRFTTAAARRLRITERVSGVHDALPLRRLPQREHRPRRASRINGTLLKPGETFSMNHTVGRAHRRERLHQGLRHRRRGLQARTSAAESARSRRRRSTRPSSPASQDVEHKAHSFYISRYPVGREATVVWPTST